MTSWLPQINTAQCTACGACVAACPTHVLGIIAQKATLITAHACNYCGACEDACPSSAIALPYQICFKPIEYPIKGDNPHE